MITHVLTVHKQTNNTYANIHNMVLTDIQAIASQYQPRRTRNGFGSGGSSKTNKVPTLEMTRKQKDRERTLARKRARFEAHNPMDFLSNKYTSISNQSAREGTDYNPLLQMTPEQAFTRRVINGEVRLSEIRKNLAIVRDNLGYFYDNSQLDTRNIYHVSLPQGYAEDEDPLLNSRMVMICTDTETVYVLVLRISGRRD